MAPTVLRGRIHLWTATSAGVDNESLPQQQQQQQLTTDRHRADSILNNASYIDRNRHSTSPQTRFRKPAIRAYLLKMLLRARLERAPAWKQQEKERSSSPNRPF